MGLLFSKIELGASSQTGGRRRHPAAFVFETITSARTGLETSWNGLQRQRITGFRALRLWADGCLGSRHGSTRLYTACGGLPDTCTKSAQLAVCHTLQRGLWIASDGQSKTESRF